MRHATALFSALALALLLALPAAAQVIHVDKELIDFGPMNQQESRDTQITVTNNGGGMLEIQEVKADCGCTVPTLNQETLAPGESTIIDINFNSKLFNGHVVKLVHILSNDPMTPDKIISIQANVFAPLLVDPETRRLGFSQTSSGTRHTKRVVFTATNAPELQIQARKSRKGLFEVGVENNYQGDPRKAALVVTIPEDMPAGRQRDNVRVKTNLPEKEHVDIDLSAWPVLALRTSVDKINYRYKKDLSRTIQVMPHEGELEFRVTEVTCDLPEIQIKVEELTRNHQTAIRLTGTAIGKTDPRAQKSKGNIKGTLTIHTDLAELPKLEIPISYRVRM